VSLSRETDRVLPHNSDAEASVIGAAVLREEVHMSKSPVDLVREFFKKRQELARMEGHVIELVTMLAKVPRERWPEIIRDVCDFFGDDVDAEDLQALVGQPEEWKDHLVEG
jgi:hypothetical protein